MPRPPSKLEDDDNGVLATSYSDAEDGEDEARKTDDNGDVTGGLFIAMSRLFRST